MAPQLRWPTPIGDSDAFLTHCWQRNELFMPGAIDFDPPLDINDLAGLATLDGVESTLIRTRQINGNAHYAVSHGPFDDQTLQQLGEADWTLLIHDVDVHAPQTRALFDAVHFIPSWRIDNLMVSIAAPGGSVGAHADSYDVMLLQGDGERTWHTAPADAGKAIAEHPLRLRADVSFEHSLRTRCGDILYVPPGVIHHGVADSLCSTWSLGMQAPLLSDIAALADGTVAAGTDEQARYRDHNIVAHEPGQILPADVAHLPINGASIEQLIVSLGVLVTQCKPHLLAAPDFAQTQLMRADAARFAWAYIDAQCVVFANGQYLYTNCAARLAIVEILDNGLWPEDSDPELTRWMIATGALQPLNDAGN